MTKESIPVVVLSDYDMLNAFVSVGYVFDSTHNKQYISLCVHDNFGYPMADKDLHIAVDDVQAMIDALIDQLTTFQEVQR
jgi:hypothetical protein